MRSSELNKIDWLVLSLWAFFLALAGPFLISARDTILFGIGIACLIGLIFVTVERVKHHIKGKSE